MWVAWLNEIIAYLCIYYIYGSACTNTHAHTLMFLQKLESSIGCSVNGSPGILPTLLRTLAENHPGSALWSFGVRTQQVKISVLLCPGPVVWIISDKLGLSFLLSSTIMVIPLICPVNSGGFTYLTHPRECLPQDENSLHLRALRHAPQF